MSEELDPRKKKEIDDLVAYILSKHPEVGKPPIHDMVKLVNNYGVVEEREFAETYSDVTGFMVLPHKHNSGNIPVFVLNKRNSQVERNYTLGHQFGHWLLHQTALRSDHALGVVFKGAAEDTGIGPMELQADYFASCFILPEDPPKLNHEGPDGEKRAVQATGEELSDKYGLPQEVIRLRYESIRGKS